MSLELIYEVEDKLRPWEGYNEANPFGNIDACLRDALLAIIPATNRIGRKIREIRHQYEKRFDASGKPDPKFLKGRQLLKSIYVLYMIGEINNRIKELEGLMAVEMDGNDVMKFHDELNFC